MKLAACGLSHFVGYGAIRSRLPPWSGGKIDDGAEGLYGYLAESGRLTPLSTLRRPSGSRQADDQVAFTVGANPNLVS